MAVRVTVNSQGLHSSGETDIDRAAREAANQEAIDRWNEDSFHEELATAITNEIVLGFEHTNVIDLMSQVHNVGFNDRYIVREVQGLQAFWTASDGFIETSNLNKKSTDVGRDEIGFHVYDFTDNILANFADNQADLIRLGIERLDAGINQRFLRLIRAATASGSGYYTSNAGVTLAGLNAAISRVRDQSLSGNVTIIGRGSMIDGLYDTLLGTSGGGTNFTPNVNEDLLLRNVLGTYRDVQIIRLANWKDDLGTAYVPGNEMYVVADDATHTVFYGGLQASEDVDPNWRWSYKARKQVGFFIAHPERMQTIVDTNKSA